MIRNLFKWLAVYLCGLVLMIGVVYAFFPSMTLYLAAMLERHQAGLVVKQQAVDDQTLSYLEGGQGEVLLLLHGFAANKDNWTRISSHLTPHFRVIIPDLPGFGESGVAANGDYRLAAQVERLNVFMEHLNIQRFHLGGHSMGGHLAVMYADRYPSSVKSLLLVAPSGVSGAKASELDVMLSQGKLSPLRVQALKDYEQLLDFVFFERPFIPESVRQLFAEQALRYQPLHDQILTQLAQEKRPSLEDLLKDKRLPTWVIWGAEDRVLHVSGANVLAGVLPDNHTHVMEATGHLPMIERPSEMAAIYLRFQNKP